MSNPEDAPQTSQPGSPWALKVATVAGIPVRIHVTFLLLLAYFGFVGQQTSGNWAIWVLFTLLLFFCVVLHEFGHALTARRYGIETRHITLYPFGGVALFEGRMKPAQELWIALAGPLVNVVICILTAAYLVIFNGGIPLPTGDLLGEGMLPALFYTNALLAIFNLIPAFPMDGGRVLRSMLALRMDERQATAIAGTIGQTIAIVGGLLALLGGNFLLALICVFVFLGAGQEMAATTTRTFLEGHRVRDAMQVRFRTIEHGANLQTAAEMLLAGSQHDFPVTAGQEIAGVLTRTDIARGLAEEGPSGYVAGHMTRGALVVEPSLALEEVMEMFATNGGTPILVVENGELLGMLTQENLSEFIMLKHAMGQSGYRRSA